MWPSATRTEAFQASIRGGTTYQQRMLRLFGIPERAASTLREAEEGIDCFGEPEITTSPPARREVEAVIRSEPGTEAARDAVIDLVLDRHGVRLPTDRASTSRWRALTAPGRGGESAPWLMGRARHPRWRLGVRPQRGGLRRPDQGALPGRGFEPIARMAPCRRRWPTRWADGALKGGSTPIRYRDHRRGRAPAAGRRRPVGYVCWSVKDSNGGVVARDVQIPGDRAEIRDRSTTVAMHLVRRLPVASSRRFEGAPSGAHGAPAPGRRGRSRAGSPRTRLFVALDLSGLGAAGDRWMARASPRWTRRAAASVRGNLHVTLCFLGWRAEKEVPRIADVTAACAGSPGLANGPRARAGAAAEAAPVRTRHGGRGRERGCCRRLSREAPAAAGMFEPERRPFWPHVTLARVKRGGWRPPLDGTEPPPAEPFEASEVTLYRSTLRPQGALHELPLARTTLKG